MWGKAFLALGALFALAACAQLEAELRAARSPTATPAASSPECDRMTAAAAVPRLTISEATFSPAGLIDGTTIQAPDHCVVRGVIDSRTGAGGRAFGIGFELRMPTPWNGRFLFQGGEGFDGVVRPALGAIPWSGATAEPALARGYAVVSTDAGHSGADMAFATDQQARLDYAYNALGRVTVEAKALVTRYYGRGPERSYIMGCGNGGRQAMIAAQRYPVEFDGVVACAPGFNSARASVASAWNIAQLSRVAPQDAARRPVMAQALGQADLQLVGIALLQACDDLDGLSDGMIFNRAACRFDPGALLCPPRRTVGCLTAPKVAALRAVFGGPQDSARRPLYSSFPYDAGIASGNWREWMLGTAQTGAPNSRHATQGWVALTRYFITPPQTSGDALSFDFDTVWPLIWQQAAATDATSTYLTSFAARGGKLILLQGLSDPVYSADDLAAWYDRMARDTAGAGGAQSFARLYLAPGVTHCGGGIGADNVDPLAAIEAWVERGFAPDRLVARSRFSGDVTRPLCPYPLSARYNGRGDPSSADSFTCQR
jgi:feruloyl esterase